MVIFVEASKDVKSVAQQHGLAALGAGRSQMQWMYAEVVGTIP